jgi:hypothetical protein
VGVAQCIAAPAPLDLISETRSNGKARLHAAVSTKIAADTNTGNDGEMVRRNPAVTGAMMPVLPWST